MVNLYFITILVITTMTIPEGWLQWTQSYSDKTACETVIKQKKAEIIFAASEYLRKGGKTFLFAKKLECLTYEEAVRRNTELGH